MSAIPPDYDSDPERRQAWVAPQDVHEMIGPVFLSRIVVGWCYCSCGTTQGW